MRFLMVDRVLSCEPGVSARAQKCVTMESDVFEHHFPGVPIFPGVLVVECLAQTAGYLLELSYERRIVVVLHSIRRATFIRPVVPGDVLELQVQLDHADANAARVSGEVLVETDTVARAELTFGIGDADEHNHGDALRAREQLRASLERRPLRG